MHSPSLQLTRRKEGREGGEEERQTIKAEVEFLFALRAQADEDDFFGGAEGGRGGN